MNYIEMVIWMKKPSRPWAKKPTVQRDLFELEADWRDFGRPLPVGGAAVDVLTVKPAKGVAVLTVVARYRAELVLKQKETFDIVTLRLWLSKLSWKSKSDYGNRCSTCDSKP